MYPQCMFCSKLLKIFFFSIEIFHLYSVNCMSGSHNACQKLTEILRNFDIKPAITLEFPNNSCRPKEAILASDFSKIIPKSSSRNYFYR